MASYHSHLMFSSCLGAAYGGAAAWYLQLGWGPVFLGAGLTALGGLLPDLDSDSGVPVRELFSLAAAVFPLMLIRRLLRNGFGHEEILAILGLSYLVIRYGLSEIFKRLSVHRGMFHSIPAMFIAGLAVFLFNHHAQQNIRLFLSVGVMIGFLSHLVLDELCAGDFMGLAIKPNQFAGSALKFRSKSLPATLACYSLLGLCLYLSWDDLGQVMKEGVNSPGTASLTGATQGRGSFLPSLTPLPRPGNPDTTRRLVPLPR